eukprot:6198315-Pleurochrysis_carterae.AAC.3
MDIAMQPGICAVLCHYVTIVSYTIDNNQEVSLLDGHRFYATVKLRGQEFSNGEHRNDSGNETAMQESLTHAEV